MYRLLSELDLICRLLVVDPASRLTAADALAHPYFAELHQPGGEACGPPIPPELFQFDCDPDFPPERVVRKCQRLLTC
jgi:mitogen-activated protein kinase 1/3